MKINREALLARLDAAFDELEKFIDIPMTMRAMLPMVKLQLPDLLADEDKRQEIMGLLQLVGWAIGYTVTYCEDDSIMEVEKIAGGESA